MEFYFADQNRINTGILPRDAYLDMDIGKENDFKLTIPLSMYDREKMIHGGFVYSPNTEFGGILNSYEVDTGKNEISFSGKSFRGMLQEGYTKVENGQDYAIVNGDVQTCMRTAIGSPLYDGLIVLPNVAAGVSVSNLQLTRYCDWLDASYQILRKVNRKPLINIVEDADGDLIKFHVELTSEPIKDLSEEIENSQDGLVHFVITKADKKPFDYILALGQGELKDRTVIYLKINEDGSLTEVSSIPLNARTYKYDYASAEDRETLIEESKKQASEINGTDTQKITIGDNVKASIDDIVGGRDYVTGTYIKQAITKVIYKYSNHIESYSYTIGDE